MVVEGRAGSRSFCAAYRAGCEVAAARGFAEVQNAAKSEKIHFALAKRDGAAEGTRQDGLQQPRASPPSLEPPSALTFNLSAPSALIQDPQMISCFSGWGKTCSLRLTRGRSDISTATRVLTSSILPLSLVLLCLLEVDDNCVF